MHLRRNANGPGRRRGIVLLIVLAMLTLFAIAGLTFVLYAEAAAESARINRDSESFTAVSGPDMDVNQAFALFLGQFIYGVDDTNGVESSLRGHSLAETMYGSYDANYASSGPAVVPPLTTPLVPSDAPYDGTGRLHETVAATGQDGYNMVNYTYFPTDGFLRDPSRPGTRASVYLPSPPAAANTPVPRNQYTGGQNAPYTYPDLNSMFLASISLTGNTPVVTTPSYYRSWMADWSSPQGKYTVLRPRPVDMGPGFPALAAPTGDVINLVGVSQQPDSMWIDIGAPVLTTAAGLRYKMLVAPCVLDLDNKVNVNVAGNVFATANANGNLHAGDQGCGPWEVNLSKVLNSTAAPNEWENLFNGNPLTGVVGRYGAGKLPAPSFLLSGAVPHAYAPVDLNGVIDPGNPGAFTATPVWSLPNVGQGYFANFPSQGYGNGGGLETTNAGGQPAIPFFFNPMVQATGAPNRLLTIQNNANVLWAGPSASPGSDLVQLCPKNFSASDTTTIRRILETTTLSMDLDRPGASPYIYDPSTTAYSVAYSVTAPGQGSYTSTGVTPPTFPTISPRQAAPAQQGEFDPNTWRSTLAATLSRIDLNRTLAVYPANGVQPPDRYQFAMDIFTRLLAVTGMNAAYNNLNPASTTPPSAAQYATLRWLAQLSANIVDYIDTDDVMTAFQWTQSPQAPDTGYVFGTELPKLVVNEVYLEYDNNSGDPTMIANPTPPPAQIQAATKAYNMNVWAELLNPLPAPPPNDANGPNNAILVNGSGVAAYQLVITSPNQALRNAANLAGDPDGATPGVPPTAFTPQPYTLTGTPPGSYSANAAGGQILAIVNNWGGVQSVMPVGANQTSTPGANSTQQGFLVIGPSNPLPFGGTTPQPPTTLTQLQTTVTAAGMTYTVPNGDNTADQPVPPTILLQRLANPNLAFNAVSNPYVTVDYVDMNQVQTATGKKVVNDVRGFNSKGPNPNWTANSNFIQNPNHRYSYGRNQPYGAVATAWQQQQAPANPALTANQPTTTFYDVNTAPANGAPPDWLVHLDRPLISPMELLHVSGFKPHELTQQFYKGANGNFHHVAPWTKQTYLLYRLLEYVRTGNATPGIVAGGRVPGKVNINTIDPNAPEVFQALCDAELGNKFTSADVTAVFNQLMTQRTPNGTPGQNDQPFWGMAPGYSSGGDAMGTTARGINQTLLAALSPSANPPPTVTNQLLLMPPSQTGQTNPPSLPHPYQEYELLRKIFSNVTTRSNVFAVWLTVGFFQVTNDTTTPVKLGAEVNLAQGKNIRHHMFAIVDRTQLQTFSTTTSAAIAAPVAPATQATASIGIPNSIPDTRTGRTWQVQAGSWLVYDPGLASEETVAVLANGTTANFTKAHASGATVMSRGNPGPWKLPAPATLPYDPQQDPQVVPYRVIID